VIQRFKCLLKGHAWGPSEVAPGRDRLYPWWSGQVDVKKQCARCGYTTNPLLAQPEVGSGVAFQMRGRKKVTVWP
jgi:hypothetical protein